MVLESGPASLPFQLAKDGARRFCSGTMAATWSPPRQAWSWVERQGACSQVVASLRGRGPHVEGLALHKAKCSGLGGAWGLQDTEIPSALWEGTLDGSDVKARTLLQKAGADP